MHIERVQVEEGFLRGLDLQFEPGLNVVIGPRGVGKTSLVELIRFCLASPAFTDKDAELAREHALSVLGTGQVTVTLRDGDQRIVVSRSVEDTAPQTSSKFAPPTVLAQSEIEAIGLSAAGRLRLLDRFDSQRQTSSRTESLRSQLQSQTTEIAALGRELEEVAERITTLDPAASELAQAQKQQANVLASVSATSTQQNRLEALQKESARLAAVSSVLARSDESLQAWASLLEQTLRSAPSLEGWPAGVGQEDMLAGARAALGDVVRSLRGARARLDDVRADFARLRGDADAQARSLAEQTRSIRIELDSVQEGAGAVARQVALLSERVAQRTALVNLLTTRTNEYNGRVEERRTTYGRLSAIRKLRFDNRATVAERINQELGPAINVTVLEGAADASYVDAIGAALRGSGVHYNQLAPQLAEKFGPRELVEAVEKGDVQLIARATRISSDRAARVVAGLRGTGTSAIIGATINDTVRMSLLDGKEYKDTEKLSTGQRCTVVLPILLAHRGETLVIDQPEDHLDNAFVTETVIRAIERRKLTDQVIVTTHNPNIPVLGGADLVVLLGSDGKRSFVRHAEELDHPQSVAAITTVMEGGIEAFKRRARYYSSNTIARS